MILVKDFDCERICAIRGSSAQAGYPTQSECPVSNPVHLFVRNLREPFAIVTRKILEGMLGQGTGLPGAGGSREIVYRPRSFMRSFIVPAMVLFFEPK